MNRKFLTIFMVCLQSLLCSLKANGDIITPPGLNPGDKFRLVFLTSGSRDATSSTIQDYDDFVTTFAVAAGLDTYSGSSVTWQVIGSTASVSAISRLPNSSSPLYRVDGQIVATNGADLWDGSILAPITVLEDGTSWGVPPGDGIVFTGTTADGMSNPGHALGDATVQYAFHEATNALWIDGGSLNRFDANQSSKFYGVSSELTAAVPESSSLLAICVSTAIILFRRTHRREICSKGFC